MSNNYILKDFDGGAQKTTLTAAMTNAATSFSVVDGSSFPPGSSPFVVVIDRGLATEEKVLVASRVSNSFNVLERAYDGSSAQTHALGAVVEHALDAYTVEQANRYVNLQTAKGDLVSHDGTTTQKVTVGSNNSVLVADSAQASGIKWGQVEASAISAAAISAIATQVEAQISPSGVPAGVIVPYAGVTAPTGWLLCQGQQLTTTDEPALFEAFGGATGGGYRYGGSGINFNLPNLRSRVPVGLDGSQGEFDNLGETGGAKEVILIEANLPSHRHTGTTENDGVHTHTARDFPIKSSNEFQAGSTAVGRQSVVDGQTTSQDLGHTHSFATGYTGNNQGHQNMPPYIVLNYIIKK